ncbi:hypothetical protein B0T14DRAFT_571942 [Immersiella caudata]|uniref:Uncharacterized protein n=1 Tax=Immersiella caudata TaxID=314043 RepID=A0AA39TI09_9PEZI|nr:hypothetical protein B0T14DRAFT_571942 [Immersiella caudata]
MQGFNPISGFDTGPMPGQAPAPNAGFNPRSGRDLGPAPPTRQPALSGQWPNVAPTCGYQPAIAPPPAVPAPAYYQQAPVPAPVALALTPLSFPTPAVMAAALSTSLFAAQPAPPTAEIPLKPTPGTFPPPIYQITWPPACTVIAAPTPATASTALTLPASTNPPVSCPRDHVLVRLLLTPHEPWTTADRNTTPLPFYELWVPETLTIGKFLQVLGRPADRTIIYEVAAAGNGKWYKGLEVHGYLPGVLAKTLQSIGWDSSRSGRIGEVGQREELNLWFGYR